MQLIIDRLAKRFERNEVLRDISFTFDEGKIYGLLGRNGAGKTTLFNCLNQDLRPDAGTVTLAHGTERRPLAPEDIGYVLSTPTVPEFLTAREFLQFFMEINEPLLRESHNSRSADPLDSPAAPRTIDDYFDLVRIAPPDRDKLLKDYSHGMKNKMQMLIHIIAQPPVLLLDEPLTSLDVVVAEEMKQLLRTLKSRRIVIVSTHLLDLALDLCDEIVLLSRGTLTAVDKANVGNEAFKAKIIAALREDGNE